MSVATGIARSTIGRGLVDLGLGTTPFGARVRRSGGGSKPATQIQPGLLGALNALVEPSIRGGPEAPLRWVSKSPAAFVGASNGARVRLWKRE